MRSLIFVVLLGISLTSCFQTANARHTQWIGPVRGTKTDVTIQTSFSFDGVEDANLRLSADFCSATVFLNEEKVTQVTPFDLPLPIDVRRWCRAGKNELVVVISPNGGPTAIACELELQRGETIRTIRSDSSWQIVQAENEPSKAQAFGRVDTERWWRIKSRPSVSSFADYNQWKDAQTIEGIRAAQIQVPEGFELETVYQNAKSEGSWISMTFDDKGRLLIGKEKAGLLRLTLQENKLETINDELTGCHGVHWFDGSLFVNASDSKALYRFRDTTGDDQFDEVMLLRNVPGRGGDHGRNDLTIGPDGGLYSIHGDAVRLPEGFSSRVPITHEFEAGHPKGGHLIRTDVDGSTWEVFASGLRNPYGVVFNRDGEAFTYDADSERHVGLPWYRATRMNHLVPGTDYGWRSDGELPWPIYYPDSLTPNVLIGRGSPTSIKFAYASDFPTTYQRALFAPDWSFGRLFAVHVVPRGASYSMHPETFLRGRPLNITDIEFGADGALYMLTGGNGTPSTIYRLRYGGKQDDELPVSDQIRDRRSYSDQMRSLRRTLESYHKLDENAVATCWPFLGHSDRWIRNAARIALEHQPAQTWSDRLWAEQDADLWLPALMAILRTTKDADVNKVIGKLNSLSFEDLSPEQQLTTVRCVQWLAEYHDDVDARRILTQFDNAFPVGSREVDRELCSMLCKYGSPNVVGRTLGLFAKEIVQIDALHYLLAISATRQGWSRETREEMMRLVEGASLFQGDEGFPQVIAQLKKNTLSLLPPNELAAFEKQLREVADSTKAATTREHVKEWSLADFSQHDRKPGTGDAQLGSRIFQEAQCAKCHRLGRVGRAFGPDLTGVASRFSREEILDSIIEPSKQISSRFVNHVVVTNDGKTHTGQLVWNGFRKSVVRLAPDPMQMHKTIEILKHDIEEQTESKLSPMPKGLLDTFSKREILGLLAYLEQTMQ